MKNLSDKIGFESPAFSLSKQKKEDLRKKHTHMYTITTAQNIC